MIGNKSIMSSELLRIFRDAMQNYLVISGLPSIPVEYGSVTGKGGLAFIYKPVPKILLHRNLSIYLRNHTDYGRVWYLLQAIGHEGKHYKQYLRQKNLGISFTEMIFPEKEAYIEGQLFADTNIGRYSKQDINPILSNIASSAITGVGLGLGFKGVDFITGKFRRKK